MNLEPVFSIDGYSAVVTGGASGIGLGYVEVLARNGARVTMLDVDERNTDVEVMRLQSDGLDVIGAVVDVTDREAVDDAIDAAAARSGRLDAVFANAGIDPGPGFLAAWVGGERPRNPDGALENYSDERWNRVIDINLNGVFVTMRAAARHMKPQRSGSIVVTTSVAATQNEPAIGAAYMAAKAATRHLTASVAHELAAYGVTVNAIAPGFIVTNIGGGHSKHPDVQEGMAKMIPMHRIGYPSDLAGLALFLVSPASRYITGQEIKVDGGWSLGPAD